MLYQGVLYHHHMPAGKLEEVLQFLFPKAVQVAAMKGCWTPRPTTNTVLAEWPVLVAQHGHSDAEGNKWLWVMHPTWRSSCQSPNATNHCYHTFQVVACWLYSIETMMELDQPPNGVNLLVFGDHFTQHFMVYVTLNQTSKLLLSLCGKAIS